MFSDSGVFSAPAYPIESVFDPTGAGDSFAGGFMGYLASVDNMTDANIRQAIIVGSVMASFDVEDFSLNRLKKLTTAEIENRYDEFKQLTYFDDL
jgi:sugar/nucleoside kinase (ribokinase family)